MGRPRKTDVPMETNSQQEEKLKVLNQALLDLDKKF